MRSMALLLFSLAVAAPAAAVPTTMTYAGVLTEGGVRVEGVVDVTMQLFDDDSAGTLHYSEDLPGLVIVDGELVADIGSNALDDATLELPELWLEVTVDGTVLAPRVRLNSVPYALRAEAALRAEEALTLGGLLPSDLVTAQQLATLGLANGLLAGAGIDVSEGSVSLVTAGVTTAKLASGAVTTAKILDANVTLAKLASNSVDAAKIVDGSVTSTDIATDTIAAVDIATGAIGAAELAVGSVGAAAILDGSVGVDDIGAAAVTTSELASGAVDTADLSRSRPIYEVVSSGCLESLGTLMRINTCTRDTAGCGASQCRDCNTNVCGSVNCALTFCFNDEAGNIVGPD